MVETFSSEDVRNKPSNCVNREDAKLAMIIAEDEKSRWKRIGKAMEKSDVGCRNRARQLGLSK